MKAGGYGRGLRSEKVRVKEKRKWVAHIFKTLAKDCAFRVYLSKKYEMSILSTRTLMILKPTPRLHRD